MIEAGNRIGLKYLQPVLNQNISSETYLSLFKKIGKELIASPIKYLRILLVMLRN